MRRLPRHLFTLCSAVSLLLCVEVCVLWARSYGTDQFVWNRIDGTRSIASAHGHVVIRLDLGNRSRLPAQWFGLWHTREKGSPANKVMPHLSIDVGSTYVEWNRGGFAWYSYRPRDGNYLVARARAPHWSLAAVTAVSPLAWTTLHLRSRARRRRREQSGHCPACGYDLRASPERCPECGTVTAQLLS